MKIGRIARASASLTFAALVMIACGSPDQGSAFKARSSGPAAGGGDDPGDLTGGETGRDDSVSPSSACATSTTKAEGAPVELVFMVDRSGSMKDQGKWPAAVAALKAFFADGAGAGLRASLHFFSADANTCSPAAYQTPAVAMTALPDGPAFATAIDKMVPEGGTPTLPALQGAIAYAQEMQTQRPEVKAVVVLVTDGEPQGCNSTVPTVSGAAQASAGKIPTYVIGVGDELTSLNAVAQAGGTKQAVIVSTTNPASISADFGKAIADIRQRALSCDYKLPAAPDGQSLDADKVNVQFTPGGGGAATLSYNKDCAGGVGWRYDDASAPTKIEVCPASCDAVRNDTKGKMDILFGCATKGGVIK